MEGLWHSERLDSSVQQFITTARCILVDLYITGWRLDMTAKEKLQTHNLYKVMFQHELYLSNIKSVNLRVSMSRLRLSSHNLAIETGRYHLRTARHHRYCRQCNTLDIEDEYHFMCKCVKHNDIRNRYIPQYYRTNCSVAKYIQLMKLTQENPEVCLSVAKYIYYAGKDRTQ